MQTPATKEQEASWTGRNQVGNEKLEIGGTDTAVEQTETVGLNSDTGRLEH